MQRAIAAVLVVAGLALGGWALTDRTGDDVGTVTVGAEDTRAESPAGPTPTPAPSTTASASPAASATPLAARTPAPTAPAIGRSSGRLADVDLAPPPPPTSISLPSIGVEAAVVPVGVDPDGLMGVPEDVRTAGWYRWGSAPASAQGTVVVAGHVDDREQGRGAFFDLRVVEVGDEVTLTDAEGATSTWRVTGRRTFDKSSLPVEDLYRRDGPPRLVLITCGGEFDRAARSYESNVVVEAEPLP